MKKGYLLLLIGLALAVVAVAGVDFSGTWAMNATKSDQMGQRGGGGGGGRGGGGELTIKQTGNEISITRGQNETKYVCDGTEQTATTARGELKYKAVLSGDTLTITGTQTGQRGPSPVNEKYTLSADGKELTITRVVNMQGQESTFKQVYDKK